MTPLMDIAQVMRFFNDIENFNGFFSMVFSTVFCRTKFQVLSRTEVKRNSELKPKFDIYVKPGQIDQ